MYTYLCTSLQIFLGFLILDLTAQMPEIPNLQCNLKLIDFFSF